MIRTRPISGKPLLLTVLLAMVAAQGLSAQESASSFRRLMRQMASPFAHLDSAAVYRPASRWNVSATGDLRMAGSTLVNSLVQDGKPLTLTMGLKELLYSGAGLYGGYGGLTLGYSREIGRKSAEFSKSYSLDYVGPGQGLQVQYLDIHQPMTYSLVIGEESDPDATRQAGVSDKPGRMTQFTVDGVWALNRRTFAYPAVYKGLLAQRRSAGSVLLGAKFLQGELTSDPEDTMSDFIYGIKRQSTMQFSLGAGYSYNLVAFHHQPGADGRGLKNLCFNFTMLPMLTLYDRFATSRVTEEGGQGAKLVQHPVEARMRIAYLARAGAAYTQDRWYLALTTRYDSFSFRGKTTVRSSYSTYDIKTTGHFYKWSAALKFAWKF